MKKSFTHTIKNLYNWSDIGKCEVIENDYAA